MTARELAQLVKSALEENKAIKINELDVTSLTDIADRFIICSATSRRHASTLADKVIFHSKVGGTHPLGVEGLEDGEWILIDLQDVIVHIMLPEVRDFYALEKLWQMPQSQAL